MNPKRLAIALPLKKVIYPAIMTLIFVSVFISPTLVEAGNPHNEEITITGGSTIKQSVILVSGSINGVAIELECFVSQHNCHIPKLGIYELVRLPEGAGDYNDCENVSLYEKSATANSTSKIEVGRYCLLGDSTNAKE